MLSVSLSCLNLLKFVQNVGRSNLRNEGRVLRWGMTVRKRKGRAPTCTTMLVVKIDPMEAAGIAGLRANSST